MGTRKLAISDWELVEELEAGASQVEVALKHGVTPECISARLRALREHSVAPAARRAKEVVDHTLTAAEQLADNLSTLRAVEEACLRELRSDQYELDVGPRAAEVSVSIPSDKPGEPPRRVPLLQLLAEHEIDYRTVDVKTEDPRKLLLKTVDALRQHTEFAMKLVDRIYHAQEVEKFQQDVLAAIEGVDEQTAAKIRGAIHARRTLRLALDAPRPPG